MSKTTRLLVLGVVRIFQPIHGYDVRRELVSWHAEEWANVAPGSIYNALKSLTKDNLLEVVGTKAIGGRPERTSYRLTTRGEQELSELLRDALWTVRMPIDPLVGVISLIGFIDRTELISALDARAAKIAGDLQHAEYVINAIDGVETPNHVREMMRLIYARIGAELDWGQAFKARLQAGEYETLGSPSPATRPVPKLKSASYAGPRDREKKRTAARAKAAKPAKRR